MKKALLVITGILIGFIFCLVTSGEVIRAEEPDLEEKIFTIEKHGYGAHLPFEYEIIHSSYGNFVVVRPRYGCSEDFHVAGIR